MKKIYIAPEMIVVKTMTSGIIAGSDPKLNIDMNAENGTTPDLFESREDHAWDIWGD